MKECWVLIFVVSCLLSGCGGGSSATPLMTPMLSFEPSSLAFNTWLVGSTSSEQVEKLTNTGSSALAIDGVVVDGTNAADFVPISVCAATLGAGASCSIQVTFTPSQLGQRNAFIAITDNEAGGQVLVPINGIGVISGPNATLSVGSLTFANQSVGTTSPTQAVTVSNYGTAPLGIVSISVGTGNFDETSNCSSTLEPGASCAVSVTFAPQATGSLNDVVSLIDSAPNSPQTMSLSGFGVGGQCISRGQECRSDRDCCPGLVCVPASTRAFCEP
jgi:hypothetical protein